MKRSSPHSRHRCSVLGCIASGRFRPGGRGGRNGAFYSECDFRLTDAEGKIVKEILA